MAKNGLASLRNKLGWTQEDAAAKAGMSLGGYRKLEYGERELKAPQIAAFAKLFGATSEEVMGDGAMHERVVVPFHEVEGDDSDFDADAYEGVTSAQPYKPKLEGGRPEIDAKPGAGLGTTGQHVAINSKGIATGHRVVAEWVIPEDYLRHEFGATPSKVLIMEVIGDSMKGTLEPGDRIFVDTSQNVFGADAVYVIDDGDGEPRVKRLEKILFSNPPEVAIVSDNPATRREERASLETLRVVGRVVGRATKM